MKQSQHALIDLLRRRKYGRTNFIKYALGGGYNRRKEVYLFHDAGILKQHHSSGDGSIERAYPMYWHRIWSLAARDLTLNWHDIMVDDIMMAIEGWAKQNDVPFKDGSEILAGRPFDLPCEIKWDFGRDKRSETFKGRIQPDALFQLGNQHFLLEADRNNEDIYAGTFKDKKSWLRSLLQYGHMFENKTYREWGIPSVKLLVVTTGSEVHVDNIMNCLDDKIGATTDKIWFKSLPVLGDTRKCPTPDLDLFGEWKLVDETPTRNLRQEVM